MNPSFFIHSRRRFIQGMTVGAAAFSTPGVFAEELTRTPRQTEGPFYPNKLPLDTDNDLLILNDSITPAVGQVAYLSGRVFSESGEPLRGATVEIWEADSNGVYIHTGSPRQENIDKHFQGFGRFLTGSKGEYFFRTIKPKRYGGRAPHIHFAVKVKGKRMLTTQCYIKGDPQNLRDGPLNSIRDAKARESLIVDFVPLRQSKVGEVAVKFDIVIGKTPEDPSEDRGRKGPRRR
jgi:protocatechuate 3,4-dioxygenase beta subunit